MEKLDAGKADAFLSTQANKSEKGVESLYPVSFGPADTEGKVPQPLHGLGHPLGTVPDAGSVRVPCFEVPCVPGFVTCCVCPSGDACPDGDGAAHVPAERVHVLQDEGSCPQEPEDPSHA